MKKALVLLLVLAVMLTGFYGKVKALTAASVSANPNTTGSVTAYTFTITLGSNLTTSDDVYIVFPTEFTVPLGSITSSVTIGGSPVTSADCSSQTVTIRPSGSISGTITLVISSFAVIRNPYTLPGSASSYTYTDFKISTSKETTQYYFPLAIYQGVRDLGLTVTPSSAGDIANYYITFTPNINHVAGDYVFIDFPSDTTIPSTFQPSYIYVNSSQCSNVTRWSSTRLQIVLPTPLNAGAPANINIYLGFGIHNPSTG